MSKMIQIRDVPARLHGELKARAAREGMSLSDYLKRELERLVERPTMREWLELTRHSKPIAVKMSAAQALRELRDSSAQDAASQGRQKTLPPRSVVRG